jgi:hypothetical protein
MTQGPLLTHETTVFGTGNDDLRTHIDVRHPPANVPRETGDSMTDAQFAELKALLTQLLTPGYELSLLYLEKYKADVAAQQAAAQPHVPVATVSETKPA